MLCIRATMKKKKENDVESVQCNCGIAESFPWPVRLVREGVNLSSRCRLAEPYPSNDANEQKAGIELVLLC